MADQGVTFIRKNGKIIPIHAAQGVLQAPGKIAGAAVGQVTAPLKEHTEKRVAQLKTAASAVHNGANSVTSHVHEGLVKAGIVKTPEIKVNRHLDALGLGLSVASGVVGAATFSSGTKGLVGGFLAGHGLDALGTAANVGSVAGRGFRKERFKQAGRQELRNFVVGNGIFAAGVLGIKKNRQTLVSATKRLITFGKKALGG